METRRKYFNKALPVPQKPPQVTQQLVQQPDRLQRENIQGKQVFALLTAGHRPYRREPEWASEEVLDATETRKLLRQLPFGSYRQLEADHEEFMHDNASTAPAAGSRDSAQHGVGLADLVGEEEASREVTAVDDGTGLNTSLLSNLGFVFKDNKDGTYTLASTPIKHSDIQIPVRLFRLLLQGKLIDATIDYVQESRCTASGAGLESPFVGRLTSFVIQAVNCYGNKRTTGGDVFEVGVVGDPSIRFAITDNNNGTYTVLYTPNGDASISIRYQGAHIHASPIGVVVNYVDVSRCTVRGAGLINPVLGQRTSFVIQAVDRFGNKRTTGGDVFEVAAIPHHALVVADNLNGTYTVVYTPKTKSDIQFSIKYQGVLIRASPFQVAVNYIEASRCTASGARFMNPRLGQQACFAIQAVYRFGNKCASGGDLFEVEAIGDPSLKFAVNDNRNGTYDVAFTLSHSSVKIVVRHNGEHINGSPLSFLKTSQPSRIITDMLAPRLASMLPPNSTLIHLGTCWDKAAFTPAYFWSLVEDKGGILVIVRNTNKHVFGGFAQDVFTPIDKHWSQCWIPGHVSNFVFTLGSSTSPAVKLLKTSPSDGLGVHVLRRCIHHGCRV
jgi:hypothetical protein